MNNKITIPMSGVAKNKNDTLLPYVLASPEYQSNIVVPVPCSFCGNGEENWKKLKDAEDVLLEIVKKEQNEKISKVHRFCRSCGSIPLEKSNISFCGNLCRTRYVRLKKVINESEITAVETSGFRFQTKGYYYILANSKKIIVSNRNNDATFLWKKISNSKDAVKEVVSAWERNRLFSIVSINKDEVCFLVSKEETSDYVTHAFSYALVLIQEKGEML